MIILVFFSHFSYSFDYQGGGVSYPERKKKKNVIYSSMFQRTPLNGTYFASVWLGAKLADWNGQGTFDLVSYGPPLTKDSFYWWSVQCSMMFLCLINNSLVHRCHRLEKNQLL